MHEGGWFREVTYLNLTTNSQHGTSSPSSAAVVATSSRRPGACVVSEAGGGGGRGVRLMREGYVVLPAWSSFPTTHLKLSQHVLLLGRRHTPADRGQAAPSSAHAPALVLVVLDAAAR